ncbi:hypothetical protein R0K05_25775, partial [Planococcus sp. SIMBA_160]
EVAAKSRRELAKEIGLCLDAVMAEDGGKIELLAQRNVVTDVLNAMLEEVRAKVEAERAEADANGTGGAMASGVNSL